MNVAFGKSLLADFHQQHQFRYGYQYADRDVELVTLRLRARLSSPKARAVAVPTPRKALTAEKRRVWFSGKAVPAALYERAQMTVGKKLQGPAIVTEYSATSVVPRTSIFYLDRVANLIIEVQKAKAPR